MTFDHRSRCLILKDQPVIQLPRRKSHAGNEGQQDNFFRAQHIFADHRAGEVALLDSWVTTNPKCPDNLKKMKRLDAIFLTPCAQRSLRGFAGRWRKNTSRQSWRFLKPPSGLGAGIQRSGEAMGQRRNGARGRIRSDHDACLPFQFHRGKRQADLCRRTSVFIVRMPGGLTVFHAGRYRRIRRHEIDRGIVQAGYCLPADRDNFTMGPREAAHAIRLLGVKHVIPMHYGTFPVLTGHTEAVARRIQRHRRTGNSRVETGREPMKLPKNLRSGFMQEDVEDYLYDCCRRATGHQRNGRICRGAQRAHYRPARWRACWRCWCRFPEPKEYLNWARRSDTPLSGWHGRRDRRQKSLIRTAIRKMPSELRIFQARGSGLADTGRDGRRSDVAEENYRQV